MRTQSNLLTATHTFENASLHHTSAKSTTSQAANVTRGDELPGKIWMLWFQGWHQAPFLQKQCLRSWQLYNPHWEVNAISNDDLPTVLEEDFEVYRKLVQDNPDTLQVQGQSDLLRFFILKRHGGVWADSTMLCRRPLDEWLRDTMVAGFFAFGPEDSPYLMGPSVPLVSSFLAAAPGHPIVVSALRRFVSYWELKPEGVGGPLGYFWSHWIVGRSVGIAELCEGSDHGDPEAIERWQLMPKRTGEYGKPGPNLFMQKGWLAPEKLLDTPPSHDTRAVILCDRETPLVKLSSRSDFVDAIDNPNSGIHLLLNSTATSAMAFSECTRDRTCSPWRVQSQECALLNAEATSDTTLRIGSQSFWYIVAAATVAACLLLVVLSWRHSRVLEIPK